MPSDTTYLYFQRGRGHSVDPFITSTGWTRHQSIRATSPCVSRTTPGLTSYRAQSLPPPQFSHVTSVLNGATVHRRASISVPYSPTLYNYRPTAHSLTPSLLYTTSSKGSLTPLYSHSGVFLTPIKSYSPSKGGIIVTAPQRFTPATSTKSFEFSRPTAFYKAPTSAHYSAPTSAIYSAPSNARGGAQRPRDWSARRHTSTNEKRIKNESRSVSTTWERADNGYGNIKMLQSKDKIVNGPRVISYETKTNPYPTNQKSSMAQLRSELKSRAEVARNQLNKQKAMLDRYLPISMDKPNDVDDEIANKYGELLIRMPHLEYSHRSNKNRLDDEHMTPLIITPYTPAPYTKHEKIDKLVGLALPPVRNSFTPKVSDTRKHARRVLCKIKGDPKYFDYSD